MKTPKSPIHQLVKGQSLGLLLLALLTVGSAIAVVYTKHLCRNLNIKLQQLQVARDSLHIEWTQLLLEQSTFASDIRVERIAREELGMVIPSLKQVLVVRP